MAESSNNRWWNRELALVGAGGALVTILAAMLAEVLIPYWSHSRRGAIVAACAGFYICMAPLVYRRLRGDKRVRASQRRAP